MKTTERQREAQRRWREAHPLYQREWAAKNPEKSRARAKQYRETHPDKVRAREKAYREANPEKHRAHVIARRLDPQPCEVCGTEEQLHAHHEDYSKPLEVRWLCAKHHREVHRTCV